MTDASEKQGVSNHIHGATSPYVNLTKHAKSFSEGSKSHPEITLNEDVNRRTIQIMLATI